MTNRIIKFRAWDKIEKIMSQWDEIAVTPIWEGKPEEPISMLKDAWKAIENCRVIMQFTSLFDKNGKEIYEGDIVEIDGEISRDHNLPPNRQVIEYIENAFLPRPHGEVFEIIGNIYENPELIKQ